MANIDLDILIPDRDETVTIRDKDKTEYELKMFVPYGVSIASVKAYKENKDVPESNLDILEQFLGMQHEHMTRGWIIENLSMGKQEALCALLIDKINEDRDKIAQFKNNTIPDESKKKGVHSSTVK